MIILSIQGILMGSVAFIFGILALVGGLYEFKKSMIISNTPTEKVGSASTGRTELKGKARKMNELVNKPFSEGKTILTDWIIKEYHPTDDGSDWDTVDEGRDYVSFYLEDDTGKIEVEPTESSTWKWSNKSETKIIVDYDEAPNKHIQQFCIDNDIDLDPSEKRRFEMKCLDVNNDTYVFGGNIDRDIDGKINNNTDTVLRTKISEDPGSGFFIISDMDENSLDSKLDKNALIWVSLGVLFSTIGLAVLLGVIL